MSPVKKQAFRPKNTKYPKELKTLGDHVRAKRLDLDLEQQDVAKLIGVDECTITNWELNRCQPEIRYYQNISDFLGYCPWEPTTNFGEQLRLFRIYQGLSYERLAKLLDVDPGSLRRWESGRCLPPKKQRKKIEDFSENLTFRV